MFNCELRRWRVVRWALLGASTALLLLLLVDPSPASAQLVWPHTITVTGITATSATVSWQGSCYTNSPRVILLLGSLYNSPTVESPLLPSGTTSYTFTGLTPNKRYGYANSQSNFYGRNRVSCIANAGHTNAYATFLNFSTPVRPGDICTPTNNPPESLGDPLPLAAGETLSVTGDLPVAATGSPCLDSSGRQSKYFTLVIPTGGEGAARVQYLRGFSSLSGQLFVRAGEDAYTGSVIGTSFLHVSAGTYTVQLRSTTIFSISDDAAGGAYNVRVTRLQPAFSTSEYANGVAVLWNAGASGLSLKIEYRLTTDTTWTEATSSVAADSNRIARQVISGLDAGQPFVTRAAYYNSSYFTDESPVQVVFGDVRLPPPYNLSVENRLLSEDPLSYEVRAAWEAPVVVVEGGDASNFDWGYYVRLNEGQPYKSDGQSQEDLFIWTLPGLLAVRAMVWMDCEYTVATSICDVNYGGVDYDIPGTELWVSTWSNAGSVNLVGVVDEVGSVLGPSEPDPAVIQLIYAIFDGIGQERSATLAKTLSVLLCLALGLAGGKFILSKVGATFMGVVLSVAFFMFIFAGLGISLFGVPPALVVVMVVLPLMGAAMMLIRRVSPQ